MDKSSRIYVAGHRGLVGSAIVRRLRGEGYGKLLTRTSRELDLREQGAVREFFERERPEYVFLAAARVGGILANDTWPADFIYQNLMIEANVIESARLSGVAKLLFLGSTCIYPRMAPQPLKEEYLLTGPLEPTNEWYAVAKIAGIKLCQAYQRQYGARFISAMPTNLYGPGDNFDLETSHVIPALIRKFAEAQDSSAPSVTLWGDGSPTREFLYAPDAAEGIILGAEHMETSQPVNLGSGQEISIRDLATKISALVGYQGELVWDTSRPNGQPRRALDTTRAKDLFGFEARTPLDQGLKQTIEWYQQVHIQPEPADKPL
jgi:GDP-L-fucose synthase